MRWAAPILYAILLLLGYWIILDRQRPAPAPMIAAHDLPANHRIGPGDLAAAGPPQYVTRAIKSGERLKSGDIVGFPPLKLEPGFVPLVFTVGAGLVDSGDIDGGKTVQICKGQDVKIKSAPVSAAICDPTDTVCWIVVAVAANSSNGLGDWFGKEPLPTVVPANAKC